MTLPQILPSWAPWWLQLALLVLVLLFGLLFLLMPFSVFGLKGRMDVIEARLDEIQGEIRSLALRLPEPMGGRTADLDYGLHGSGAFDAEHALPSRPPIPPAPQVAPRRGAAQGPSTRSEPRLFL